MRRDRWRQVDELFGRALEHEGGARAAFLAEACAGDPSLRREVEALLKIDSQAGNFIEEPVLELAARLLTDDTAPLGSAKSGGARSGPPPKPHTSHTADSIDDARFVPGEVLAERYRVVGLLGRGGMGEVYRADDLKLKQPVALKFLPERLAGDREATGRFYREVSVARQISHRHVCRVYDVSEAGGQHFISMEFVRGEELSSLLKRIGRLPQDKAVEIARQLCAGLAAIHEKGVLHRDLKPANVMIDERGDVRITDFGIAALAEEAGGRETQAGTPAYMSPEQLEGRELSARSDIYSLGLVLYELFTGRRAFEAASLPELLALRRSATAPTSPSKLIPDLDPVVERVISRCLEREPHARPVTALAVAAALPGGDPLAAALAAGETPSPEMVAAAPKQGALRPPVAVALLASVLVGLALVMLMSGRVSLHRLVSLKKSPDALKERAGDIARRLGYAAPPVDTAHGFSYDVENLIYLRDVDTTPDRWQRAAAGHPPVVIFWHRQSPRYLEPYNAWLIDTTDPPHAVSGMTLVVLDTEGRLTYFEAVPPQVYEEQPGAARTNAEAPTTGAATNTGATATNLETARPDWASLFADAGLDFNSFRPAPSRWTPPQHADARAAWEGTYADRPDMPLRVEAASHAGRAVYFEVVNQWRKPARQTPVEESAADRAGFALLLAFYFVPLVVAALLAWRNLRLGRGDRRGAFRLALFIFTMKLLHWLFFAHHVPTAYEFYGLFLVGLQSATYTAFFVGLLYLALEPFLRRRRPEWLISWSRLLAGDLRDPLVGRDILIGSVLGVCMMIGFYLDELAPVLLGQPLNIPNISSGLLYTLGLLGLNGFVPLLVNQTVSSIQFTFIAAFLLLSFSMLLRGRRRGIAAGWLVLSLLSLAATDSRTPTVMLLTLIPPTIVVLAVARFGLLTLIFTFMFVHLSVFFPVTTELSAWYAGGFILDLLVLLALVLHGFRTSLAGQPLLGGRLLED